jgi:hypothetical protein
MNKSVESFLKNNRDAFRTADGLPGAMLREAMIASVTARAMVGIVTPHGNILTGHAVMPAACGGWVLNLGGRSGTPSIATAENCIYAVGAAALLKVARRG